LGGAIATNGFSLTVSGGAGAITFANALTGSGSLTDSATGTVTLSGSTLSTLSGGTTVLAGILLLNVTGGTAVPGSLTIGGGTSAAQVQLLAANQIADGAAVTVNSNGQLDLNGYSDSIGTLTINSTTVSTEAGTLTVTGSITDTGNS